MIHFFPYTFDSSLKQIYILLKILNYVHLPKKKSFSFAVFFFHLANGVRGLHKAQTHIFMCKRIEACRFLSAGMKRLRTKKKEVKFSWLFAVENVKLWGITFFHFLLSIHTLFLSPDWCNAKHGVMDLWRQLTRICWCWGFRLWDSDRVELKDFL